MYLAIDIGATKTLIAAFSRIGLKLKTLKFATPATESAFLQQLKLNLDQFRRYRPTTVVVAIPGRIDKNTSVDFGNRPWHGPTLPRAIEALFPCPVLFENDANLATISEAAHYKTKNKTIFLTFSTGIGGGIAKNGQLLPTPSAAFEPGHTRYDFRGKNLEWEDFASCQAIGKAYHGLVTSLHTREAYQDIAARLTPGLTDIIKAHRPDVIIIGGPLALIFRKIRPYLLTSLRTATSAPLPRLVAARRPNQSVIYGCYLLAKNLPQ